MSKQAHTIKPAGRLAALAVPVALLLAGCGSANKNGNGPTAGNQQQSFQSIASTAYKYSACMRSHGVPDFPDPQVVSNAHEQVIHQGLPAAVGDSPRFKTAQNACKALAPPQRGPAQQRGEDGQARAKYLLAFAQCLRTHGVQGFPDPTAQGQLSMTMIRAAGVDLLAPSVLTAAKACVSVTHGAITLAQVQQAIHHAGAETQHAAGESGAGG